MEYGFESVLSSVPASIWIPKPEGIHELGSGAINGLTLFKAMPPK